MNVADLDRSIDFYRDVYGFTELARRDQLAAISAGAEDRVQVIILRALGTTGVTGGARHTGMRALVLETESLAELEKVAAALERHGALVAKRTGSSWEAVFGRDPDYTAVVAGCSRDSGPIGLEAWAALDESLYGVGE
jgi:catechol 2,3-dioxygenase-like lactoylglutathione lyase family enzyme